MGWAGNPGEGIELIQSALAAGGARVGVIGSLGVRVQEILDPFGPTAGGPLPESAPDPANDSLP